MVIRAVMFACVFLVVSLALITCFCLDDRCMGDRSWRY